MPQDSPGWVRRFTLAGRRAIVTGASRGIGAEIARVYADAGADIVAVARDPDGLESVAAEVRALRRDCLTVVADLADADGTRQAARRALDTGPVDILVNAAGIARLGPATGLTVQDWDATMAVNLRAPFLLAQAVAPAMIARRAGKIVNVSSQAGVIALDDHAAYIASKGGLNALTKSLCAEWGRHNIQVNAICPTVVMTDMGRRNWSDPARRDPFIAATPARRFAEPVEVADMALFLASAASDMVNGSLLMVEGGFTSV
jgi:NAD(P)-dependent dehydrogenase (short-subunit alcohol dehydrogenase family)